MSIETAWIVAQPLATKLYCDNDNSSLDHCCSLMNDVWRPSSTEISTWSGAADQKGQSKNDKNKALPGATSMTTGRSDQSAAYSGAAMTHQPPSRNYADPIRRAIVTFDVEMVGANNPAVETTKHQIFIRKPWGITTNINTEQIFVADRQAHVVLVFSPDGEFQFQFGGPGSELGKFNRPTGLAYDGAADRLVVVDKDNHRIQTFSPSGQFLSSFGSRGVKPGQFWFPWDVAVSRDGSLIAVSDARNHRIQLFTSDGCYLRQFAASTRIQKSRMTKATLNYPRGLSFDPTGQFLYVTDFNSHSVFKLDVSCRHLETLVDETHLYRPSGIDVDVDGNILVCDTRNHSVKIFSPAGQPIRSLCSLGDESFDLPLDVAVMKAGFVAALDLNGRVRVF